MRLILKILVFEIKWSSVLSVTLLLTLTIFSSYRVFRKPMHHSNHTALKSSWPHECCFRVTGSVVLLVDFYSKCLWRVLANIACFILFIVHTPLTYLRLDVSPPPCIYSSTFQFTLVRKDLCFWRRNFLLFKKKQKKKTLQQ